MRATLAPASVERRTHDPPTGRDRERREVASEGQDAAGRNAADAWDGRVDGAAQLRVREDERSVVELWYEARRLKERERGAARGNSIRLPGRQRGEAFRPWREVWKNCGSGRRGWSANECPEKNRGRLEMEENKTC
jgi:hypothetical protein